MTVLTASAARANLYRLIDQATESHQPVPGPDILQTIGTAVRNAGLVGIGYAILRRAGRRPTARD